MLSLKLCVVQGYQMVLNYCNTYNELYEWISNGLPYLRWNKMSLSYVS